MMSFWYVTLGQIWMWGGVWLFRWRFYKLVQEEKEIQNPDSSFYRRNDNDFLKLIFCFFLWIMIPSSLFGLWLHATGQIHGTRHGG